MHDLHIYDVAYHIVHGQSSGAKTRCCEHFGQSAGPTHFGGLYCLGTENRVTDCDYYNDTSGDFYRSDWGVHCSPGRCMQYPNMK